MKRRLTILLVLFATTSFAAPFLSWDAPPANETINRYEVTEDAGSTVATVASRSYDIAHLPLGTTTIMVRAVGTVTYTGSDGSVVTGEEMTSDWSDPFDVVKSGGATAPVGCTLSMAEQL